MQPDELFPWLIHTLKYVYKKKDGTIKKFSAFSDRFGVNTESHSMQKIFQPRSATLSQRASLDWCNGKGATPICAIRQDSPSETVVCPPYWRNKPHCSFQVVSCEYSSPVAPSGFDRLTVPGYRLLLADRLRREGGLYCSCVPRVGSSGKWPCSSLKGWT